MSLKWYPRLLTAPYYYFSPIPLDHVYRATIKTEKQKLGTEKVGAYVEVGKQVSNIIGKQKSSYLQQFNASRVLRLMRTNRLVRVRSHPVDPLAIVPRCKSAPCPECRVSFKAVRALLTSRG
jgi:hypothetical protein